MIEHNTSNNRIAVVFLAATFAVALYSALIEVLSALQISFFAADDRVGLPPFTCGCAICRNIRYAIRAPMDQKRRRKTNGC